jgi:hypothetical protein
MRYKLTALPLSYECSTTLSRTWERGRYIRKIAVSRFINIFIHHSVMADNLIFFTIFCRMTKVLDKYARIGYAKPMEFLADTLKVALANPSKNFPISHIMAERKKHGEISY